MDPDVAGIETRGIETPAVDSDGDSPLGSSSPAGRLLGLALRSGGRSEGALPWHLAVHLARTAVAEDEAPPAPLGERDLVAHALGKALAAALDGAPSDEQAARLVGWLRPLLRLDRSHGVDVLGGLCAALSDEDAATVQETVGAALLRMLDELDPTAADPADPGGASPGLVRDLATIGAFALDGGPEGPGGSVWPVVIHGVFRHLGAIAERLGPAAVARWIRLCPSRAALRYVSGLDLLRDDPVLLGTLLLHGGPREIAVALAALRHVDPDAPVRAAVVGFFRREKVFTSRRAAWLFDQVGRLPDALPELREALLDRLERGRGEGQAPITDDLLRPVRRGVVEAALLAGRTLPAEVRDDVLERLLDAVRETLAGEAPGTAPADAVWLRAIAHAVRECWRGTDAAGRREIRKRVVRALADVESLLGRRAVHAARAVGTMDAAALVPRFRALAALALHLARALPDDEAAESFALALYELALRLRAARTEALVGHPAYRSLEPILADAPDPRDADCVEEVGTFLERWRALDLRAHDALPPADTAPISTGHTLGVARLPSETSAEPASAEEPGDDRPRRSLLRRLWH